MLNRIIQFIKHRLFTPPLVFRPTIRKNSIRLGTDYGGWSVIPEQIHQQAIIYSVGIGEDISFDLALIEQFDVQIFAFDPTPKSLQWLKSQNLPKKFRYFSYGLANFDGKSRFFAPDNPNYVSHTLIEKQNDVPVIEVEMRRLKTIMFELGHNAIDLLKMDIEGAEYGVIEDLITMEKLPRQLLIEFHHGMYPGISLEQTKLAVQTLLQKGYAIFQVSATGRELHFVLPDKKNE